MLNVHILDSPSESVNVYCTGYGILVRNSEFGRYDFLTVIDFPTGLCATGSVQSTTAIGVPNGSVAPIFEGHPLMTGGCTGSAMIGGWG